MYRLSCFLFLCTVGCSSGAIAPVPLYPVTGTLKVSGVLMTDSAVQLIPVDATSKARPGVGRTDKDGKFTIMTNGSRGANVGKFKVVLSSGADEPTPASEMSNEERYEQAGKISGGLSKSKGASQTKRSFPKEWASAKTSPKEVEVVDRAVVVDIDI